MPELKELAIDTPSSSGESEKLKDSFQRKKKKISKHALAHPHSQIPRANSARRIDSSIGQPCVEKFKEPSSKSLVPYRIRKSLSQMDIKQSKKSYNPYSKNVFQDSYSNIALPKPVRVQGTRPVQDIFYPTKGDLFYVVSEPEVIGGLAAKAAGMKIFATVMLNAWRKRRDDVRRLNEEVDQFHKMSTKLKNQIHVLNSVFRSEQKQNDQLRRQLRHAADGSQRLQSSVEGLTTSLISAKAEASLFEQQLHGKDQENDALSNILKDTKCQLFQSMAQIRHLQTSLSCQQRNVQQLENQKNELLNEITVNEVKCKKEEEQYLLKMYQKDEQLSKANSEIKMLETLLLGLKEKEFQARELKESEWRLKNEIILLKTEVDSLKEELNKCLSARVKNFWKKYVELNRNTLLLFHIGAFYLLPAFPPPRTLKMPVTMGLRKVMSIFIG